MAQQQRESMTGRVQGGAQALWSRLMHFLREVRLEFNKINWPSRAELTALTILVLLTVFMLAFYIGGLDFGFREAVQQFLKR